MPTARASVPAATKAGASIGAATRTGSPTSRTTSVAFIPGLILHEFEALLFADPLKLAGAAPQADRERVGIALVAIRDAFTDPEHIDHDAPPSKRIAACIPSYQKVAFGVDLAEEIGLAAIRAACPSFDGWVTRLEELGEAQVDDPLG